jgi:hypothetical protein
VLGCGGRYHGDPAADAGGRPNGSGANAATGAASGSEPGSSNGGSPPGGGYVSPAFEPFPIATESGTVEPVEPPGWVDYDWSADASSAAFEICEQGWTPQEADAEMDQLDLALGNSRLVDSDELVGCWGVSPSPRGCSEKLIHFFPLPDGTTGGVTLTRSSSELSILYFRILGDCSVQRLGQYFENFSTPSCDDFGWYTLWGIPPISEERQQCRPTNGMYSFDAVVTEDSCGVTPARFTGVLGFTQDDSELGSLWFPQFPEFPVILPGIGVRFREGQVYGTGGQYNDCHYGGMALTLDPGSKLTFTIDFKLCADDGERVCTWKMESTRITGPI